MTDPRWLAIVRHRVPRVRAPYLLILQHHAIPAVTRVAAPITRPVGGDVDLLAPQVEIAGMIHRVRLLDLAAIPRSLVAETVGSAEDVADAVLSALDVLLHGYPVGAPR